MVNDDVFYALYDCIVFLNNILDEHRRIDLLEYYSLLLSSSCSTCAVAVAVVVVVLRVYVFPVFPARSMWRCGYGGNAKYLLF